MFVIKTRPKLVLLFSFSSSFCGKNIYVYKIKLTMNIRRSYGKKHLPPTKKKEKREREKKDNNNNKKTRTKKQQQKNKKKTQQQQRNKEKTRKLQSNSALVVAEHNYRRLDLRHNIVPGLRKF